MVGETLGPYRLLAELGSGGMGKVYRAKVEGRAPGIKAGTEVALKVVHPHLLDEPGFFKRFLREAEIGKRIVHENVVRTFDADAIRVEGEPVHFLVMEYVEGQTLRSLLAELGRVPEELCRHIGREAAKGLAAIHAGGVVHRDVKPENILITREHVVKVMDLGVARLVQEHLRLSQTGAFVGSVQYAPPEQFGSEDEVDGRTDIYSLGVTLYELATGQNPFADADVQKTLRRVLQEAPRRCAELNPQLSPFFEETVHTLLAKRPGERFASAAALAGILEQGEESEWWRARARHIRATTKRPLRRIRIPRETALYGREAEIERLRAMYEKAKAGEGQAVLVEGEAGIGKSRLVDEFVGILQREGEDLNFLHGSYPPGGAATAAGAFTTAYREQFGVEDLEETLRAYLSDTPILVPAFAALLKGEGVPQGVEALTKDSMQTVFVRSTRRLAAERPTVVLIDDLHFAPQEGRSLLAALAMAVPGHRILLVGTLRPGVDETWLGNLDRIGVRRMTLSRLGPKDLSRLLVEALRSESLAEQLAYRIATKTDGNPFFVFEILRGLREGRVLAQRDDGSWVTTGRIAEIQIPSSILELVRARVAELDDAERNLLDVAACAGFEFDPVLVAKVLGLGKIPAMQALAKIEKRHRLVRSNVRHFVFDQHQVHEALYGGLPVMLREEYHAAIAEAIEELGAAAGKDPKTLDGGLCVDLCRHFFDGNRNDRALHYLDAALAHMDRGYQNDDASKLARRALAAKDLLPGLDRCRLLLHDARRLELLGRTDEEIRSLEDAKGLADATGDKGLMAKVRNELGDHFRRLSRNADAEATLSESLALYREVGEREGEAVATVNLGIVAWALGRFEEARAHVERSLALSIEAGHRRMEATATLNLGMVSWSQGRYDEARTHYERCLAICREIGDRLNEVIAAGNLGVVDWSQGRYAEARAHYERSLEGAREIGYRAAEAQALDCLGTVSMALGRLDESRGYVERNLALRREFGDRFGEATANLGLGLVLAEQGRAEEARTHVATALTAFRAIGARVGEANALAALGAMLADDGTPEEAVRPLAEAAVLAREIPLPGVRLVVAARLASLPGADRAAAAAAALAALSDGESSSEIGEVMAARFLLWKATGDASHLADAKARLDGLLLHAPSDCRESMIENVRLHREIHAAAAGSPDA